MNNNSNTCPYGVKESWMATSHNISRLVGWCLKIPSHRMHKERLHSSFTLLQNNLTAFGDVIIHSVLIAYRQTVLSQVFSTYLSSQSCVPLGNSHHSFSKQKKKKKKMTVYLRLPGSAILKKKSFIESAMPFSIQLQPHDLLIYYWNPAKSCPQVI